MDMQPRVTRVSEEVAIDAQGKVVSMMRVEFNVGMHGPFIERFPKAGFSALTVQAKLREIASTITQLAPQS